MSQDSDSKPTNLGIYDRPRRAPVSGIELSAAGLSLVWLALSGWYFLGGGGQAGQAETLQFLMTLLVVFLPVAMIWVAATAMRSSMVMREEAARLQTAIDALRTAYVTSTQRQAGGSDLSIAKKLDEIAAAQRKTETALTMFQSSREPRPAPMPEPDGEAPADQPTLALGTPAEELAPPIGSADLIRALNFPETAEDEQGFAALRRALRDRGTAQLVQAAQDVLTLLSQDGIYMDDLRPDVARPEIWRQFANGTRGRAMAALGGVRDRSSLALTAGRMRQDPIFRDAAHHFLRVFDRRFTDFEKTATDSEIRAMAETRTARAFMLLGRVAGTFD